MAILLTEEQRAAIAASPRCDVDVRDPQNDQLYKLIPAEEWERIEELRDRLEQEAWAKFARRNLIRRIVEDEEAAVDEGNL